MELQDYKAGDNVQVLMDNIKENKLEWRDGVVTEIKTIEPGRGERHKPYPMVMVKTTRTFFRSIPDYGWTTEGVRVYKRDLGYYYDKENTEGFLFKKDIRPV